VNAATKANGHLAETNGRGLSSSIEDYVTTIWRLSEDGGQATGLAIATALGVSQASVTGMCKRLDSLGLVSYEPYQAVELTEAGRAVALENVRHHRLIELFLHRALDMPWDEVHEEAEILEHHISERLEARIAAWLDNPQFDPHGDPIPQLDGSMPALDCTKLSAVEPNTKATVQRVTAGDPERLRYLAQLGVQPGRSIVVLQHAPFDGPVTLRNEEGEEHAIARELAEVIDVDA
jgi:DtxR family Mn-dependent transcriptional regulator